MPDGTKCATIYFEMFLKNSLGSFLIDRILNQGNQMYLDMHICIAFDTFYELWTECPSLIAYDYFKQELVDVSIIHHSHSHMKFLVNIMSCGMVAEAFTTFIPVVCIFQWAFDITFSFLCFATALPDLKFWEHDQLKWNFEIFGFIWNFHERGENKIQILKIFFNLLDTTSSKYNTKMTLNQVLIFETFTKSKNGNILEFFET